MWTGVLPSSQFQLRFRFAPFRFHFREAVGEWLRLSSFFHCLFVYDSPSTTNIGVFHIIHVQSRKSKSNGKRLFKPPPSYLCKCHVISFDRVEYARQDFHTYTNIYTCTCSYYANNIPKARRRKMILIAFLANNRIIFWFKSMNMPLSDWFDEYATILNVNNARNEEKEQKLKRNRAIEMGERGGWWRRARERERDNDGKFEMYIHAMQ